MKNFVKKCCVFMLVFIIFIVLYHYTLHTYGISLLDFLVFHKTIFSIIETKKILLAFLLPLVPFAYFIFEKKKNFIVFLFLILPLVVDFFLIPEKSIEDFGFTGKGPFDEFHCYPSVEKDGIYLHTCYCNTTNSISRFVEFPFWSKGLYVKLCAKQAGGDGILTNISFAGLKKAYFVSPDSCISVFFPRSRGIAYLKIESSVFGNCNYEDTIVREILIV